MHSHRILWHLLLWIVWPSCWACAQALSEAEFLKQFEQHLQANLNEDATLKRWEEAEFWLEDQQDDEDLWKRNDAVILRGYPPPDVSATAADWMRAAMVQALRDDVKQAKHFYQESCKLAAPSSLTPGLVAFAVTDDHAWAADMVPKVQASRWLDSPELFRRMVRGLKSPAVIQKLLLSCLDVIRQSVTPSLKATRCLALMDSLGSWESALGRTRELVSVLETYIDCVMADSPEISPIAQSAFVLMVEVATELDAQIKPDRYVTLAWKIAGALRIAKHQSATELTTIMDEAGVPELSRNGISVDDYLIRATLYSKPEDEKKARLLDYLTSTTEGGAAHPVAWLLDQRNAKPAELAKLAAKYLTDPVEQKAYQDFPAGLQQLVLLLQWSGKPAENAARLDALFEATETLASSASQFLLSWCELRWKTFSKLPADQHDVIAWMESYAKRCATRTIVFEEWQLGGDPFDRNDPFAKTATFGGLKDEFSVFWSFAVKDIESALRFGPIHKRLAYQYGLPFELRFTPSVLPSGETMSAERWQELLLNSTLWAGSAEFEDDGFSGWMPSCFLYCVDAAFKAGLRAPKEIPKGGLPLGRAVFFACMESEPMERVLELMLVRQKELLQAPFKCHAALTGILQQFEMQAFSLGPRPPLRPELESLMVVYRAMASLQPEEMLRSYAVVTQATPVKRYGLDLPRSLLPLAWRVCPKWFWEYLELYHSRLFAIRQAGPLDELGQGYAWQFEVDLKEVFDCPFWAGPWHPSKSEFVHLIKFMSDVVADGTLPHFDARNLFQRANWLEIMKNGQLRVDWKDLVKSVGSAIPQRDLPLILRPLLDLIDQECRTEYGTVGFSLQETAWMESAVKEKGSHAWLAQWLLDCVALRQAMVKSYPDLNPLRCLNDVYYPTPFLPAVVSPTKQLRATQQRILDFKFSSAVSAELKIFYYGDLFEWGSIHVGEESVLRAGEVLASFSYKEVEELTGGQWNSSVTDNIINPLLTMASAGRDESAKAARAELMRIMEGWRGARRGILDSPDLLDIALILHDEKALAEALPKQAPSLSLLIRLLRANLVEDARALWKQKWPEVIQDPIEAFGRCKTWWRADDEIPALGPFLSGLPEEDRLAVEILILMSTGHSFGYSVNMASSHLARLKDLSQKFGALPLQKLDMQLLVTEALLNHESTIDFVSMAQIERGLAWLPEIVGPPECRGQSHLLYTIELDAQSRRRASFERALAHAKAREGDWLPYQQKLQDHVTGMAAARTRVEAGGLPAKLDREYLPRPNMKYRRLDDSDFPSARIWWRSFAESILQFWTSCDAPTRQQLREFLRQQTFSDSSSVCFDPWSFFNLGEDSREWNFAERPDMIPVVDRDRARLLLTVFVHALDDSAREFADAFQSLPQERQRYLKRVAENVSWPRAMQFIRLNFPWQTIKHRLAESGGVMDRFFEIFPAKLIDHSANPKLPAEWQSIASEWSLTPSEFLDWIKR